MFSLQSPQTLPEIELYLGDHMLDMWLRLPLGEKAPHWAFAWAGGIALARWTLDNPWIVKSKTVLDIGCGSGLNTVAALKAGANTVISTDWEKRARSLTVKNLEHYFTVGDNTDKVNTVDTETVFVDDTVSVTVTDKLPPFTNIDTVLVGDVFYESADLMPVLDDALNHGCTVWVGDANRDYTPLRKLTVQQSYIIPDMQLLEARDKMPAFAYRYIPD